MQLALQEALFDMVKENLNPKLTADDVNKILAQANFLTRDVDGQRYEAEKWSQVFAKLPRECVKKILVVLGGEEESETIRILLAAGGNTQTYYARCMYRIGRCEGGICVHDRFGQKVFFWRTLMAPKARFSPMWIRISNLHFLR